MSSDYHNINAGYYIGGCEVTFDPYCSIISPSRIMYFRKSWDTQGLRIYVFVFCMCVGSLHGRMGRNFCPPLYTPEEEWHDRLASKFHPICDALLMDTKGGILSVFCMRKV